MLVCYHRSSSIGTLSFCEQKYFLTYNLGMKDKQNERCIYENVVSIGLGIWFGSVCQLLPPKQVKPMPIEL